MSKNVLRRKRTQQQSVFDVTDRIWRPVLIDKVVDEIIRQTKVIDAKSGKRLIRDDEILLSVIGMFNPSEIELARAWSPLELDADKKGYPTYDSYKTAKYLLNRINHDQKYDIEIIARPETVPTLDDNGKRKVHGMVLTIGSKETPEEYRQAASITDRKTLSRIEGDTRKHHRLQRIIRNPAAVQDLARQFLKQIAVKKKRGIIRK